jgi:hypothetical protein
VTSDRKLAANRRNSCSSTGPKTAAGKARAAINARRHGLRVPILSDPIWSAEVDTMALEIAGTSASLELRDLARQVAAAETDVVRLRRARHDLIARAFADPDHRSESEPPPQKFPWGSGKLVQIQRDYAARLAVIDGYERRALSRRKFAIRAFNEARSAADGSLETNHVNVGRGDIVRN